MTPGIERGDDTYRMPGERRAAQKTWTPQVIAAVISVILTLFAGGWSVASLVQARLDTLHDLFAAITQEVVLIKERQANQAAEFARFQGAGGRFTSADGEKLGARIDRVEGRISLIEQRQAVQEDRERRKP